MVALPRLVDTPRVQALIASGASQALGRPVRYRSLTVSVLPYPTLRLHGFEVAEDPAFGADPFVRLDEAHLRLKLMPLVRGQVEFTSLVLKRPTISLVQVPGGRWNFASLGTTREAAPAPRAPRPGGTAAASAAFVSRVVVDQGLVTYEIRRAGAAVRQHLEDVEATLSPRPGGLTFNG